MRKIEAKKIFNGKIDFLFGASAYIQIPKNHFPEIAFIGASNVGKSSLINSLVGSKIAIVSNTPGRTRQLNFFKIPNYEDGLILVDMPGYGYAKANKNDVESWQKLGFEYLTKRKNLKRLFLLLDPSKGLKDSDIEAINIFNGIAVSFQVVFTKIDKVSNVDLENFEKDIKNKIPSWAAAYPDIIKTSSAKGYGIRDLQDEIVNILQYL